MAAVLDLTSAEPSLIIKWGGMPASWRWRGHMYELAAIHAEWADESGCVWYRVESLEGTVFLLGHTARGWVSACLSRGRARVAGPAPSDLRTS